MQQAAPIERAAPAYRSPDRDLTQGYGGSHPFYGAGSRTSWTGHNISADQFRRFNQGGGSRSWGNLDTARLNGQVNRETNFYNRNYGGWNTSWADGGYWGSRPWGYGWYNWSPDTWGWWGDSSLGWGLAALAGADVISSLVNAASEQQSPVIEVPDSDYQLNYATVDSVGSGGADFSYAVAGSPPIKGAARCRARPPRPSYSMPPARWPTDPTPKARRFPKAWRAGCPAGCATCCCWPSAVDWRWPAGDSWKPASGPQPPRATGSTMPG
jgi:hypothetical protein